MAIDLVTGVKGCAMAALLFALAGCEAMVPYHRFSAWTDQERVRVVFDKVDAEHAEAITVIVPRDGKQPSLKGDPLDFEGRLGKLFAHTVSTSPRPPSYWIVKSSAEFYAAPPRPISPSARGEHGALVEIRPGIRGFHIERWMAGERACDIEFSVEVRDGAFRITLERVIMRYSRAKVADAGWRNWWTRIPLIYGLAFDVAAIFGTEYGDGAVDVQVDLQFSSNWTDASGESHFAPLAILGWTVLDVPLGGEVRPVGQSGGWLPLVPPAVRDTVAGEPIFGRGQFTLMAFVTEQDELSPQHVEERRALGDFFDAIMSRLPIPGF
jgi:hypothetical protein